MYRAPTVRKKSGPPKKAAPTGKWRGEEKSKVKTRTLETHKGAAPGKMDRNSPGPNVSPECIGTVVVRPSVCFRKT